MINIFFLFLILNYIVLRFMDKVFVKWNLRMDILKKIIKVKLLIVFIFFIICGFFNISKISFFIYILFLCEI